MKTYPSYMLKKAHQHTHPPTHIPAHARTVCKGLVTSNPVNSIVGFTPVNKCREDGERPGQGGGRSRDAECPPHLTGTLPLPQGWTDTEVTAAWGTAQQMSGWSPCSQGLEDVEAKAPPKSQGQKAEASGKVTGPGTCQSIKGRG